jgi:hypothetical protein
MILHDFSMILSFFDFLSDFANKYILTYKILIYKSTRHFNNLDR